MTPADGYKLQASFFRALAHPVRLQILSVLSEQEACVCHLETILGRPQPYVSQQLAILRQVGLVTDRREGTLIYYRIADEATAGWLRAGRDLVQDPDGRPIAFPAIPASKKECPCPRCQE